MASATDQRLLDPGATAAVLFGASDWTESGLGVAPSFRRSGKGFLSYLLDTAGLGLDPELILDLLDDPASAGEQLARLRDTLDGLLRERREEGRPVTDIVIYYVGHGTTDEQGHLTLLVRRSRKGLETETGIKASDLARVLRVSAPQQRRMVVLDCCFAEAAARAFVGMAATEQAFAAVAAKDIADALPTRGGLLLCSSQVGEISIGAPGGKRTLFTSALLDVLRQGADGHPPYLSFADLCKLTYDAMLEGFGASAPRPVLHAINQPQGDLSRLPAFPNVKRHRPTAEATPKAEDSPATEPAPTPRPADQNPNAAGDEDRGNTTEVSREERRLRRLGRWYSEERISAEDLDFLIPISLGGQAGRLASLVLSVLDSPNATPSSLFAVLKGAEDATLGRPPPRKTAAAPQPGNHREKGNDREKGDPDIGVVPPPPSAAIHPETSDMAKEEPARSTGAERLAGLLAEQPVTAPSNRKTLGKYEIHGILARSATSTVYDGWDPTIARRIAIKAVPLPADSDPDTMESIARFKRGAHAAGQLAHPNIVGVYSYGEADLLAFIVMEFVDGPTLKALLDKEGERFPLDRIRRIMDDLLAGLQFSHEHGVVHRDIKPANIMLTRQGVAKIADFGIARIEMNSVIQTETVIATPSYMSPEQFRGEVVDARSDVYSAGVMLYQLLTGERPFDGNLATIMNKVLNTTLRAPSQLSPNVPPAVDAVVLKATAKRPQDRYASARAFAEALNEALNQHEALNQPIVHQAVSDLDFALSMRSRLPLRAGVTVAAILATAGVAWYFVMTATGR